MGKLEPHGLYKIKDEYFSDFPSPHWMDNKGENRPYYYLFTDSDGVEWMIPMSTQMENYQNKIAKVESQRGKGNCLYYYIGKIASRDSVFLISDMFPIDSTYIMAPYTISQIHYVVKDEKLNKAIRSKAMRYLKLLEQGVMTGSKDVLGIKKILLNRRNNSDFII